MPCESMPRLSDEMSTSAQSAASASVQPYATNVSRMKPSRKSKSTTAVPADGRSKTCSLTASTCSTGSSGETAPSGSRARPAARCERDEAVAVELGLADQVVARLAVAAVQHVQHRARGEARRGGETRVLHLGLAAAASISISTVWIRDSLDL